MGCTHENFEARVEVNRLEDTGRFAANVRITCTDCGTPFRFLGLPGGLAPDHATTSVDGVEARLPIASMDEETLRIVKHAPSVRGAVHLCIISGPMPCDITGCGSTDAVFIVCNDETHTGCAVCPSCVKAMSEMNSDYAAFFAQKPALASVIRQEGEARV